MITQAILPVLIMKLRTIYLLTLWILLLKENVMCTSSECLKVTKISDEYIISCQIRKLQFEVSLYYLDNFEVASCVPPHPFPSCRCNYKNGIMTQNLSSQETVLTIKESSDYTIDGKWTCVHGRNGNSDQCSANIILPRYKELTTTNAYSNAFVDIISSSHRLCILFYSMVGILTSVLINILGISILRVIKVEWATKIKQKTSIITYGVINLLTQRCICIQDRKPKSIIVLTYVIQVILVIICFGLPFLSKEDAKDLCTDYAFWYGILEFGLFSIILLTFYRETKEEKYECLRKTNVQESDSCPLNTAQQPLSKK